MPLERAVRRFAEALATRGCAVEPTITFDAGAGRWHALVCAAPGRATDVWTLDAVSGHLIAAPCLPAELSQQRAAFLSGMGAAFDTAHDDAREHDFLTSGSPGAAGAAISLRHDRWHVALYPHSGLVLGGVMRYVLTRGTFEVVERIGTQ